MSDIEWSEEHFNIETYMANWREYIINKALWYSKISEEMKLDNTFHEDIAQRINEVIERILSEPPSEEQIAAIQVMQEKLNTHYQYDCKAEAVYVESLLKKHIES
jgi:hypothetical protein